MVGTAMDKQTGAGPQGKEKKKAMKKGTYESIMLQHDDLPLVYAMWSDNNIIRTLSTFHPPCVIKDGLMRKQKVGGVQERGQTPVTCPL